MTSFTVTYRRRELSSVGGWFVGLILSFFSSSVVEVGSYNPNYLSRINFLSSEAPGLERIKMPPKNSTAKKSEQKAKAKVIEDKTFGLKNKKGGKNQKYIANVQKQVQSGGNPDFRKQELENKKKKDEKEAERKRAEEMQSLFKAVPTQKVDAGVDPKTVFCAFFKNNLCKKGDRCKFSHDPACERKAAKRNMYQDEEKDDMDEWDEDKLAEVVAKKHGAEKSNDTDIICKFFLEAVENNKYGWFWECPLIKKGQECKYKHALPKGFVLKKDKLKKQQDEATISLEELVETERAKLDSSKLTKITLQTFVAWKKKKLKEKAAAEKKENAKKKKEYAGGNTGGMSGRDMFMMDPNILSRHEQGDDDDDDGEDFDLTREQEEDMGVKVSPTEIGRNIHYSDYFRSMKLNLMPTVSWTTAWMTPRMPSSRLKVQREEPLLWQLMRISSATRTLMTWRTSWTTWKCSSHRPVRRGGPSSCDREIGDCYYIRNDFNEFILFTQKPR